MHKVGQTPPSILLRDTPYVVAWTSAGYVLVAKASALALGAARSAQRADETLAPFDKTVYTAGSAIFRGTLFPDSL